MTVLATHGMGAGAVGTPVLPPPAAAAAAAAGAGAGAATLGGGGGVLLVAFAHGVRSGRVLRSVGAAAG